MGYMKLIFRDVRPYLEGLYLGQRPHTGVNPANTSHCNNVGRMLGQRRRRWANIQPTSLQHLLFVGNASPW